MVLIGHLYEGDTIWTKKLVMFGIMHETAAINCYQMKTNGQEIRTFGLILFKNGFLKESPDGYIVIEVS